MRGSSRSTAIVTGAGGTCCVVVEAGRSERKEVKVGLIDGKRTGVLSRLNVSDRIVEAKDSSLAEGRPVEPQAVVANPKS